MRYPLLFIAAIMLSLGPDASAQVPAPVGERQNPPMVDQQRDAEKENYFALFNDLKRVPLSDSQRKAYEAAVEYLKQFEGDNDPDARTVRKFVTEYERGARQNELSNSYASKNHTKTFELGRAMLERDPEDFFALSLLTEAGFENAQAGNATLNEATQGYAKKAIQLVEAGKVTKVEPFKDLEAARGYLNAALGTLLRDKSPAQAARAFKKAVQSDSFYRTDPLTHHRLGSAILRGEFAQLSHAYNEKFGSQPTSPAQRAMLGRINQLSGQAIDAYARAVALSASARPETLPGSEAGADRTQLSPELRNKILEQLTALYKNFHNNSDAGLNELIATVLSKPLP